MDVVWPQPEAPHYAVPNAIQPCRSSKPIGTPSNIAIRWPLMVWTAQSPDEGQFNPVDYGHIVRINITEQNRRIFVLTPPGNEVMHPVRPFFATESGKRYCANASLNTGIAL